ncbi:MAG: hypothetical protein ACRCU3_09315 [Eubacteriaceae bacterium]
MEKLNLLLIFLLGINFGGILLKKFTYEKLKGIDGAEGIVIEDGRNPRKILGKL